MFDKSIKAYEEACKVIPGGVDSPVRAFKSVGGTPPFIDRGEGAYLFDIDGNKYLDFVQSWGPLIFGHCDRDIENAVIETAKKGLSFGAPTLLETQLASEIVEMYENIDKVRFVSSGTEATMSAIRLARGVTGKNDILKFEGCYHGHSDSLLVHAGSGLATFGTPSSPGVPVDLTKHTLVCEYNNIENLKKCFEDSSDIACIIIEPIAGNMGFVPASDEFLAACRELCDANGALLIFDEVMTGFRLAFGGAQELYNVKADIVTYGKVIGGGMPVGAFAARNEIMNKLSPRGDVYQAGTLSGNPLAMRAGLTTLQLIKNNPNFYEKLNKTTETLDFEIGKILNAKGIAHKINRKGSMMSVFFHTNRVSNFEEAADSNHSLFNNFFHQLLAQGIYLPPSGYETWFISDAINDAEIDKTLEAVRNFDYSDKISD